ncbi:MAG: hypothetical protein E7081_07965 [Bacteroidales bacterium]|nr:hypothetical protein [Bacteroidales bacterium]
MRKIIFLFLFALTMTSCEQFTNKLNQIITSQNSEPSIIGNWKTNITTNKGSMEINFSIFQDGTAKMWGNNENGMTENLDNISWSKNGDIVYLYKQGEDVLEMEIRSLDINSLVVHFEGEPDDEIFYFKRY